MQVAGFDYEKKKLVAHSPLALRGLEETKKQMEKHMRLIVPLNPSGTVCDVRAHDPARVGLADPSVGAEALSCAALLLLLGWGSLWALAAKAAALAGCYLRTARGRRTGEAAFSLLVVDVAFWALMVDGKRDAAYFETAPGKGGMAESLLLCLFFLFFEARADLARGAKSSWYLAGLSAARAVLVLALANSDYVLL